MAAAAVSIPGQIEPEVTDASGSRGTVDEGGVGSGRGPGNGPGAGPGLGPGRDGNTGGGAHRAGNGVSSPRLVFSVKPTYTADAMRARVTGEAALECVVEIDGHVDRCRIVRSLDPIYGLDLQAMAAARQWRFEPGRRQGEAVPVFVSIELSFTMR